MPTRACWSDVPLGPVGYPLPSYGFGGVNLVYLTSDDRCLCGTCANDPEAFLGPAKLVGAHESGPHIECEECGNPIPSYYGDPEEGGYDRLD